MLFRSQSNNINLYTHIMSLISPKTAGGQPSGPGDLSTLSDFSLSNTDCGDTSISEISGGELEMWCLQKLGSDCYSHQLQFAGFVAINYLKIIQFMASMNLILWHTTVSTVLIMG